MPVGLPRGGAHRQRAAPLAPPLIRLDEGGVGDDVRAAPLALHLLKHLAGLLPLGACSGGQVVVGAREGGDSVRRRTSSQIAHLRTIPTQFDCITHHHHRSQPPHPPTPTITAHSLPWAQAVMREL